MKKRTRMACLILAAALFAGAAVPAQAAQEGNGAPWPIPGIGDDINPGDLPNIISPGNGSGGNTGGNGNIQSEKEPNDDIATANAIGLGKPIVGSTHSEGEVDIFKFTLKKAVYVNVSMEYTATNTGANLWFAYIRDSRGKVMNKTLDNLFATDTDGYAQSGQIKLKKGTYYVTVVGYALAYGRNYTLCVNEIKAKKPELSGVAASGYRAVDVSWKPVPGAYAYYVYRSTTKKGNYKKVATQKGTLSTAWTDKKVQTGKTYYYKVKSVVKTAKKTVSPASKVLAAKPMPQAPYVLPEAGKKRVDLRWLRVEGANGYEVYRSTTANGAYKKVKTVKKGSSTAYTDTKVKKGTTYYYKVRAYAKVKKKNVYSDYSAVVSARPE